ncbi:MAG: hypothetical protein JWL74_283 [Alphaproteobacteria bacterium]|jgi:hypothetical protein|nr:hypothetical protein [Alphaproteobacteria bacterium]
MRRAFASSLSLALLLAACARSEEASMVPPDGNQGYNRVGQVRTPEQDDREPSIGQWRAALQDERQALEFGPMGTEPLFSLLCAPQGGGVLLQRHGAASTAGAQLAMVVTIGEVSERLPVSSGIGSIPMQRGELAPTSRIFGLLVASAQPIVIRLDEVPPLILPHSPLVGDYLRGCGRAQGYGQAGNSAIGNSVAVPSGNTAAPAE